MPIRSGYRGGPGREYERLGRVQEQLPAHMRRAGGIQAALGAGYQAPSGYGELERPVIGALRQELEGGISPEQEAGIYRGVTSKFGAATGALAGRGARRGYFSREGVAAGAAGAPSAALAGGLGAAAVGIEKQRGERRVAGLGQAQAWRGEITDPRKAFEKMTALQARDIPREPYYMGRRRASMGYGYR